MMRQSTRCPEPGRWRAWLDRQDQDPTAELDRHHASCEDCRALAASLREDAEVAGAALASLEPARAPSPTELRAARADLAGRLRLPGLANAGDRPATALPPARSGWRRWRRALVGVAAALTIGLVGFTPQGQSAAAEFLAQFRSQKLAVVTIDTSIRGQTYGSLDRFGVVSGLGGRTEADEVASPAEAGRRVGFKPLLPAPGTVPSGLTGPRVMVVPETHPKFTFSRARTLAYLAREGRTDVQIPERFDGAVLNVNLPSGVVLVYGDPKRSDGLLVGQFNQVTAGVDGKVTLDELRELLLGLPGVPRETADQLRAIPDWRNTLPLPIPADRVQWREATIAGGSGLILAEQGGMGNAAIWQREGRIYGVAGTLGAAELQRVADSLR